MVSNSRFEHVDALRAVAVLLVIALHISEVYINLSPAVKESSLSLLKFFHYIDTGTIGVIIFFSISGFVLLKSIKGSKKNATKTFFIRRFLRLYPAFWLSILLGAIGMALIDKTLSIEVIIANITMLPQVFNQEMVLGLYWTLEIELLFYFIAWLMFMIDKLHNPINLFLMSVFLLAIFIVLKIVGFSNEQHIGLMTMPLNLSIMFWGGLFRIFYDNPYLKTPLFSKNIPVKILFFILTAIIFIIPVFFLLKGLINELYKSVQIGTAYILGLLLFLIGVNIIKLKNSFLVWLGTISYSMYLFHPVVFYSVFWLLKNYAPVALLELHLIVYLLVNLVLIIVFSALIYYLVEKPAIKFAHHLTSY